VCDGIAGAITPAGVVAAGAAIRCRGFGATLWRLSCTDPAADEAPGRDTATDSEGGVAAVTDSPSGEEAPPSATRDVAAAADDVSYLDTVAPAAGATAPAAGTAARAAESTGGGVEAVVVTAVGAAGG
jgi:hypothetical protein